MDVAVRGGREREREEAAKKRRASIEFLVAESVPEMSHWGNTTKRREQGEEGEEGHAASTIKLPSHQQQQQQQSEYMCVCFVRASVRACVRSVKTLCKCAVSKTSPNHTGSVFLDP